MQNQYYMYQARLQGLCKNWLKCYNSSNIITGKITGTNKINNVYKRFVRDADGSEIY